MLRLRLRLHLSGLVAALALLAACSSPVTGAASAREAVEAYVAALNANDSAALARLAPPGNDATADIRERLDAHGGQAITVSSVDLTSDISPHAASAKLKGDGSAGPYEETIVLVEIDARWYIVMGQSPAGPGKTASTNT